MRTLVTSLAAVVSFSCFSAAAAQTAWTAADGIRQTSVRYDDLDLSSPAGVAALKVRVDRAARTVCGPEPGIRELRWSGEFRDCVSRATGSAGRATVEAMLTARRGVQAAPLGAETK